MTLPARLRPPRRRRWLAILKVAVLVVLFGLSAASGTLATLYLFEAEDIPDVGQLDDHQPSIITRIHAASGDVIGEFALERRIVLEFQDIPAVVRDAIVAVEDAGFFEHHGLSPRGILRAAIENAKVGRVVEGGSSLTQQLAKLMFLTPERSFRRKLKEAVLALHIERTYSKEEILAFYCNEVYLGHNRYGVESAARFYFGKPASELEIAEAALIAGLPQRPNAYSPYNYPDAAIRRRNHVIDRMAAVAAITPEEADSARRKPLELMPYQKDANEVAPYFVEEVRKQLEERYGEKGLYHEGLHVRTTLDLELQGAAERALRTGLLDFDKRKGWRGATVNVLVESPNSSLDSWSHPRWSDDIVEGDFVPGLVTAVRGSEVIVRVGQLTATVSDCPRWTRRSRASELYRLGDVGYFRVTSLDPGMGGIGLLPEQEPAVEGAIVALEVRTGRILALVGGWDFQRSRFNRAVQALRQTGSAFKPILYTAALMNGFTPADSLFDEPIAIKDDDTGEVYSPENYSRNYYGLTTLRQALEKSRNPVSVQLLQRIGPQAAIDTARRLGLTGDLQPYPSLALGAFENTLVEMTAAYAAFADQGAVHDPYMIERIDDRHNSPLLSRHPVTRQAVSPESAFLMTQMLRGVVQNGTARQARRLGPTVAGKTGTTDDFTDAWFIGYSPTVACGVWVGYDRKKSLGKGEVGARAALPIWIEFMASALAGSAENEDYVTPPGIEFAAIDKTSGLRASDACSARFKEAFQRGTAPATYCSAEEHQLRALPYYMQKIRLEGGEVPPMSSSFEEDPSTLTDQP